MPNLKYLFEAHFNDGTSIQQTPEDVSTTNPQKSAFYDVSQRLNDVEVFGLFSDEEDTTTYVVDLRDGHFEVGGYPITVQDPRVAFSSDTKYRLIYFRKNQIHFNSGMQEVSHEIQYHIGWQATVNGENYQQTIAVE